MTIHFSGKTAMVIGSTVGIDVIVNTSVVLRVERGIVESIMQYNT